MSEWEDLDRIDRKILRALQSDGRISITDLAHKVGLSKTPCAERIKRLDRAGYIEGYRAELNLNTLGYPHIAFVQVTMERTTTDMLNRFNEAVIRIPEVEACHMIAGGFDYLLKIRSRDMGHYRTVLGDHIGTLPGVAATHTFPVMETVNDKRGLDPVLI